MAKKGIQASGIGGQAVLEGVMMKNKDTKTHGRHISASDAKKIGLKITMLEKDQKLQDAVLSVHHCYMMTFTRAKVIKVFESSTGRSFSFNG